MTLTKTNNASFLELIFGPKWTYIGSVRKFLQSFLAITLANSKHADQISMAASELLENAIKYSSDEGTKVAVKHLLNEKKIVLAVENYSAPENISTLKNEIDKVNEGTPEEAYLNKMMEAAERTDGKSQLGFARIRYEANADIEVNIKEENLVEVMVTFYL